MAQCQGMGTQSPPALLWGKLLVLKDEKVVGQGFMGPDCCVRPVPPTSVGRLAFPCNLVLYTHNLVCPIYALKVAWHVWKVQTHCPGVQDNSLPPVSAGGMDSELVLDGLEVVLEHPDIHGILGGLILVGNVRVGGQVQDA